MATKQKAKWYGPKQIGMIIYTGILMLVSACLVGGATNTVLPAIAEAHGWNAQYLNLWSGISCILDGAGILIWARLSRKSPKVMASIALFVTAVCITIFGFTNNMTVLILMMLIMGIASAAYSSTAAMTLTANWWPTQKGIVLGWSTMGIVLMSVIYAPYIPAAYAKFGIGGTNLGLGIIVLILGIVGLIFVKDTPEAAGTTPDGLTGIDLAQAKQITKELSEYKSPFTFKKMISMPNNWVISFAVGLPILVAMTFISTTIPALLSYGYSYPQAAAVFSVGGIVALVGSWAIGLLDQKAGTKKAQLVWAVLVLLAIIFACFMQKNFIFAWIAGMLLFAANGAGRNIIPSYVATVYGRWDYPAAYQMIGTIGIVCCGAGVMVTAFFPTYTSMYIFDIILLVISLILGFIAKSDMIGKKDTMEIENKLEA